MIAIRSRPGASSKPAWAESPQRVDPLGTLAARPLGTIAIAAAFGYGVVATVRHLEEVQSPALAALALVALALACCGYLLAARPAAAPFTGWAEAAIVVLALIAAALESLSRLGLNRMLQDDFGQVSLAILLVAMAPYRPAVSLIAGTVASAIGLAVLPIAQVPYLVVQVPLAEYIVVVVVLPLALGLSAAVYSAGFVRAVRGWQRRVARAALDAEPATRTGIARSVQQAQVSVISRDVLPYLTRMLAAPTIDTADIAEAAALAAALRGTLLAQIGRTWLDDVAADTTLSAGGSPTIADPDLLALGMTGEQRVACAAAVAALARDPEIGASALAVRLSAADGVVSVAITASVPHRMTRRRLERILEQYLAVARVLFFATRVDVAPAAVTVEFRYAQP